MSMSRMDALSGPQAIALACVAITIAIYAIRYYIDPLRAIPTVGGSPLPGLWYLSSRCAPPDFRAILWEGYRRYPESAFKIAHHLDRWVVIVSGRRMIEDLRKRPDDELSALLGRREVMNTAYILEASVLSDRYHAQIVKEKLTRILPDILPDVVDEISVAVRDHIVLTENVWTSIRVVPAMHNIVAQASNRAFVGLPLCRNRDYLTHAINFAAHVHTNATALQVVPGFFRPLAAFFFRRKVRHQTDLAVPHFRPIIEERMKVLAELGEGWNDKPNDMLQFILDEAIPKNESLTIIVQRLMMLNFSSIFTTATTATHALYHLAAKPELLAPLREEIEAHIAQDGWTAAALGRMWKLDSIIRETLRYNVVGLVGIYRKAMKDVILSDGTRIPRGTIVAVAQHLMHYDDSLLEHADTFDAFRYARMRHDATAADSDSTDGLRYLSTSTSPEYLPFGHGSHACPGRYFAANELKAILARIILDYDLKLDGDGTRPANVYRGMSVLPAMDGRVLFRKRQPES